MNTLEGLPLLDHYNKLLSTGEEQHAWAILHEFFSFFDKDSSRERLWFLLVMSLKSDNSEISPNDRGNMILFYEYCIALFKAASVLSRYVQKHGNKRKKAEIPDK